MGIHIEKAFPVHLSNEDRPRGSEVSEWKKKFIKKHFKAPESPSSAATAAAVERELTPEEKKLQEIKTRINVKNTCPRKLQRFSLTEFKKVFNVPVQIPVNYQGSAGTVIVSGKSVPFTKDMWEYQRNRRFPMESVDENYESYMRYFPGMVGTLQRRPLQGRFSPYYMQ